MSWSGGKDSALSLYEVKRKGTFRVLALLTTLTRGYDRVSMHGVRRDLLMRQALSLGFPLEEVWIPKVASNIEYETQMRRALLKYKRKRVKNVIFGDLFLADIRKYREEFLSSIGTRCVFPLWLRDTRALADLFISKGFKAKVCTVDPSKLHPKFCGREFDRSFVSEIPKGVDPCGENGEFHTFVYAGPIFKEKIEVAVGDVVIRDGFVFADLRRA